LISNKIKLLQMDNRSLVVKFVLNLEKEFPVNNWKINGVHIWPFVRIRLYFFLIRKNNGIHPEDEELELSAQNPGSVPDFGRNNFLIRKVKLFFSLISDSIRYFDWYRQLPKKENIFVGHMNHRIHYKGIMYNRFFDSYIKMNEIEENSLFIEHGPKAGISRANEKIILDTAPGFELFRSVLKLRRILYQRKTNELALKGYDKFIEFLNYNNFSKGFSNKFNLTGLKKELNKFYENVLYYDDIFKRIDPKKVFVLCYYDFIGMATLVAANNRNILTYDYQHGGIGNFHLAYSHWNIIPPSGYKMLPKNFWVWDNNSFKVIHSWAKITNLYVAEVRGNIWIDYLNNSVEESLKESDFILYALQPIDPGELFSKQIIHAIKSNSFKWFIRFHPTQSEKEKKLITSILIENDLMTRVEIEKANLHPLPELIKSARIIVTHFSGCAIEASLMNKKTILLNELGRECYQGIINENMAFHINYNDVKLSEKFEAIVNQISPTN
jgi:hypothetical protein